MAVIEDMLVPVAHDSMCCFVTVEVVRSVAAARGGGEGINRATVTGRV